MYTTRTSKKIASLDSTDDQPFVAIEKEEFHEIIKYLWADANIPTADTIRSDLNINFTKVKAHVKEILQVSNLI